MKKKIYILEFFALFVVAMINIIGFIYQGSLSDNYQRISSENDLSWITYYLSSFIKFMSFYSGMWIVLCFAIFALLYGFVFQRRDKEIDPFQLVFITGLSLGTAYIFFPSMVGEGMQYQLTTEFSMVSIVLGTLTFFTIVIATCFDINLENLKLSLKKLNHLFFLMFKRASNQTKKSVHLLKDNSSKAMKSLPVLKKESQSDDIPGGYFDRVAKNSDSTPAKVERPEPKSIPIEDKTVRELKPVEAKEDSQKNEASFEPLQSSAQNFFDSTDLIDCVSTGAQNRKDTNPDQQYFDEIVSALEDKLAEFKIEARVVNILKGPVVDTFELELGPGVKVSKVIGMNKDLSLALRGAQIRIVYPMEGRATVGVEVPRSPREIIFLDEVLRSDEFQKKKWRLPVAMGKNAFGEAKVLDLAGCPHMLCAGATGAGKSVFINTLLVSLLVKLSPKDLRLILIDPKQLELALYQSLPHLALPVVVKPQEAALSLLWAVQEMERRYSILKEFGVRHIDSFNDKLPRASKNELMAIHKFYEDETSEGYELPYIVIIVDEFADLILSSEGKQIENCICRLAAKARACGIHLVVATQRPSVDVITGLVKSNFPTRVSFRVTSPNDSRTVLDGGGAEMLLGKGDMLYKNGVNTHRMHSAFVGEDEVEELVQKLSDIPTEFNQSAMSFLENGGPAEESFGGNSFVAGGVMEGGEHDEPLYEQAVQIAIETRKISASFLQRRMSIGYNRAARIVEIMEEKGIIGPQQGSKPRKVLIGGDGQH